MRVFLQHHKIGPEQNSCPVCKVLVGIPVAFLALVAVVCLEHGGPLEMGNLRDFPWKLKAV